jgi:hypothetical protein
MRILSDILRENSMACQRMDKVEVNKPEECRAGQSRRKLPYAAT